MFFKLFLLALIALQLIHSGDAAPVIFFFQKMFAIKFGNFVAKGRTRTKRTAAAKGPKRFAATAAIRHTANWIAAPTTQRCAPFNRVKGNAEIRKLDEHSVRKE